MEDGLIVRIGGIKFSEELVQVTVAYKASGDSSIHELLRLIAEKDINISFLCHSMVTTIPESCFCVDRSELYKVQQILNFSSFQNEHVEIIPSVGTLTLFPQTRISCSFSRHFHFNHRSQYGLYSVGRDYRKIAKSF
jgi:hypothetical protein